MSDVFYFRHSGSFARNGLHGLEHDYFTRAFLAASDGSTHPTKIEMSHDVFGYFVQRLPQFKLPLPQDTTYRELIAFVLKSMQIAPLFFYGAEVVANPALDAGYANFYIGDKLVAETSGWVE